MRYFLAITQGLSLSPFAFSLPFVPDAQHQACTGANRLGDRLAADHAADFLNTTGPVQPLNCGDRPPAADRLLQMVVRRRARSDLREMGDADHLEPLAELLELLTHHLGDLAADPGIHFVEDQRL